MILFDSNDFERYMKELDKPYPPGYTKHQNIPKKYPCMVKTTRVFEQGRGEAFHHFFLYERAVMCPHCSKEHCVWPIQI